MPSRGSSRKQSRPRQSGLRHAAAPNATDALIGLLDRWPSPRIVVVGDFMLDRQTWGDAQRLSPDAPVPVLAMRREHSAPGGAAFVCLALRALRCQVACAGVVGDDEAGRQIVDALRDAGCDTAGIVTSGGRSTTVKHNFIGLAQHRHPQKMFRVDCEDDSPIDARTEKKLAAAAVKLLRGAAALCLEDYNKGVLTEGLCRALIARAKKQNVPVFVDPAAIRDYRKYTGATCITPNRNEATMATGVDLLAAAIDGPHADRALLDKAGRKLLRDLTLDAVVLTLDKQGALLLERGRRSALIPTEARQVYDVTGAGDVVLAALAAARSAGATWPHAVALANVAAGLEVERFGAVPVALDEVLLSLLHRRRADRGKLRSLGELLPELAAHRAAGKRIAFTNGCFDILHAGHVAYLREARRRGDLLVVAVNTDASIRRIKGQGRPVMPQSDRLTLLSELESIDYLILFDEDTPLKLIEAVRPDVLVKGGDYKKSQVVGGAFVEAHGGRVELVPLVKGRSTTSIIERVREATKRRSDEAT